MSPTPLISYSPRPDTNPERELSALAAVFAILFSEDEETAPAIGNSASPKNAEPSCAAQRGKTAAANGLEARPGAGSVTNHAVSTEEKAARANGREYAEKGSMNASRRNPSLPASS